jgi:hypothetical protein
MSASRTKLTAREVVLLRASGDFAKRQREAKDAHGGAVVTVPAPFAMSVGGRSATKKPPRHSLARYSEAEHGSDGGGLDEDEDDGAAYVEAVGVGAEKSARYLVHGRKRMARLAAKARRDFEDRLALSGGGGNGGGNGSGPPLSTVAVAPAFATDGRNFAGRRLDADPDHPDYVSAEDRQALASRGVSTSELAKFEGYGLRATLGEAQAQARSDYEARVAEAEAAGVMEEGGALTTVSQPFQFSATAGGARRRERRLELRKRQQRRDEGRHEDDEAGDPEGFEGTLVVDVDEVDEEGRRVWARTSADHDAHRLHGPHMRASAAEALALAREDFEARAESGALETVPVAPRFTVTAGQRRRLEQAKQGALRRKREGEGRASDDESGDEEGFSDEFNDEETGEAGGALLAQVMREVTASGAEAGSSAHGVGASASGLGAREEADRYFGAKMRGDMAGALAAARSAYEDRCDDDGRVLATVPSGPKFEREHTARHSNEAFGDAAWVEAHRLEVVERGVSKTQVDRFAKDLRGATSAALAEAKATFEKRREAAGGSFSSMGTVSVGPAFSAPRRAPHAKSAQEQAEDARRESHATAAEVRAHYGPKSRGATAALLAEESAAYASRQKRQREAGLGSTTLSESLGAYANPTQSSANVGSVGRGGGGGCFDDLGYAAEGCQAEGEARALLKGRGGASQALAQAKVDYGRRHANGVFAPTKAASPRAGFATPSAFKTKGVAGGSAGGGGDRGGGISTTAEHRQQWDRAARSHMAAAAEKEREAWQARRAGPSGGHTTADEALSRLAAPSPSAAASFHRPVGAKEADALAFAKASEEWAARRAASGRAVPTASLEPLAAAPKATAAVTRERLSAKEAGALEHARASEEWKRRYAKGATASDDMGTLARPKARHPDKVFASQSGIWEADPQGGKSHDQLAWQARRDAGPAGGKGRLLHTAPDALGAFAGATRASASGSLPPGHAAVDADADEATGEATDVATAPVAPAAVRAPRRASPYSPPQPTKEEMAALEEEMTAIDEGDEDLGF